MIDRVFYLIVSTALFAVAADPQPPPKQSPPPFALLRAAGSPGAVTLPAEVRGEVGAFVVIEAKTDGKSVRFVALDPGLSVFPPELLATKKATVIVAAKPGKFRILAYSAVGDEPSEPAFCTVIIGTPGPDPGPTPGPTSPLTKALQTAFDGETQADKAKLAVLVSTMEKAADMANLPALTTTGQLDSAVRAARMASLGDSLPAVRVAIGEYLAGKLPTSDTALTPELRGAAGSAYNQVAEALKGVKP